MCVVCGCNDKPDVRVEGEVQHAHHHAHEHEHVLADGTRIKHANHDHHHAHDHAHGHDDGVPAHTHSHAAYRPDAPTELVALETALLDKNQRIAERNRGWFAGRGVVALNLMSSPGSGKTSLLVRTLTDLAGQVPMSVVEGDQETSADADRIRATGAKAIQVNTGAGCHLEADMLERAIAQLAPPTGSVLFIENVGNLVCPALFDLGERARVVVLSVTEGEDKPLKYPHMFRSAELMITTKMDLAPHVDFDVDAAERHARSVNPGIQCLRVSSKTGEGMDAWYGWLQAMLKLETLR
jgi:hydrogenase nickel incorporation protein HypB